MSPILRSEKRRSSTTRKLVGSKLVKCDRCSDGFLLIGCFRDDIGKLRPSQQELVNAPAGLTAESIFGIEQATRAVASDPRICNRPTEPSNSDCVQVLFASESFLHKRFRNLPETKDEYSRPIAPRCLVCVQPTVLDYHLPL
jgi:hypothetical protein